MLNALYTSAIGLQAQKQQLDVMANNLANLGTPAYKRQTVDFSAVLDRASASRSIGAGASPQGPARSAPAQRFDPAQGPVRATGRALDVAIAGAGFVEIELPGGVTGYSRAGSLQVNAEGGLSVIGGYVLRADVRVPNGATDVQILADGSVTAKVPGDQAARPIGQIELVTFVNVESLQYRGEGVFTARDGEVEPARSRPGEDGAGTLVAGSLEGSNVQMVDEMVALMLMQRVYELNSRVAQAADELMGMSNNLRRD